MRFTEILRGSVLGKVIYLGLGNTLLTFPQIESHLHDSLDHQGASYSFIMAFWTKGRYPLSIKS